MAEPTAPAMAATSAPAVAVTSAPAFASVEPTAPTLGEDDAFMTVSVDTVRWHDISSGWQIEVNGAVVVEFSLAAELSERQTSTEERATFMAAKRKELDSFFENNVWSYPTGSIPENRLISGRFILTYADGGTRAKARLIVAACTDPDLLQLDTNSPTAMRLSRHYLSQVCIQKDVGCGCRCRISPGQPRHQKAMHQTAK